MSSKFLYAFAGLLVSALVGILINLLSAAIQQRAFADQFNTLAIWLLAGFTLIGTLIGAWLGGKVTVPITSLPSTTRSQASTKQGTVTITRLRAFLSYGKLRGKGIALSDIILIGSRLDIES